MKKAFKASAYFFLFVFLGLLWHFVVVPFLFYFTFASVPVQDQMRWDLTEFYGIARGISASASEGAPLTIADKICSVMGYIGEYGVSVWFLLGILVVFRSVRSQQDSTFTQA